MSAEPAKPAAKVPGGADNPGEAGEWSEPRPAEIPPSTYWPLALAFGTTLIALPLVTSPFFFYLGMPLVVLALYHWSRELRS